MKYLYLLFSADYLLFSIRDEKIDIAVSHFLFKATLGASFITKRLNIPLHVRLHTKRSLYTDRVLNLVLTAAAAITAESNNVKEYYEAVLREHKNIKVIRQSVNLEQLGGKVKTKPKADKVKLIAIGRLVKKKGFDLLVKAIACLSKELRESISLHIYGDGKQLESLSYLIKEHALEQVISLKGRAKHSQLMNLLPEYELLIVPSVELKRDIDGVPTVIAEAMSVGTPVLAFHTASIPELIIDGETGFLEVEKNPKALSLRIASLVLDESMRKGVVDAAKKKVQEEYNHTLAKELRHISSE